MTEPNGRSFCRRQFGRGTVTMFGPAPEVDEFDSVLASSRLDLGRMPLLLERRDAIYLPIEPRIASSIPSLYPQWTAADNQIPNFAGGLFLASGRRDPLAPLVRGPFGMFNEDKILAPSDLTVVEQPTVFLGWYFDHYGHMLIEGMARAYAIAGQPSGTHWLVGTSGPWPPAVQQNAALFAELGVNMAEVLDPRRAYRIKRLLVPEPAFLPRLSVMDAYEHPFVQLATRVASRVDASAAPVFLSRSRLSRSMFWNADESSLEQLLVSFGVMVVHPEILTLHQQIQLFNNHSTFIGLQGSAFHNKMWAMKPLTCFMLSPYCNENFLLFDAVKGGTSHYGEVFSLGDASGGQEICLRIDWVAFADWLERLGFAGAAQAGRLRDEAARRLRET